MWATNSYFDKFSGIKYPDLAYGSAHGFATLGTNNGHNGASARAMLNNEDVIIDYSYRA